MVNRTGRTMALNRAMRMTATAASRARPTAMPGMIHAVASNEIVPTSRVMTRRLNKAQGPPRHSHRMRSWVA